MTPRIRLLGGNALRDPAGRTVTLPTRKSWALLGYLTQSGGREIPREEVAALLWPASGEGQARASLRQELAVLRKGLEAAGLAPFAASKEVLSYAPDPDLVDTRRMERRLSDPGLDAVREAADLFKGEFLGGIAIRSDSFDEWLWLERQRLKNMVLGGLLRLLREDEASGQSARAIATASAILTVEPTQEQAHRALMRLYRRTHRRAEALRQFRHCADVLRRDLDTDPSRATQDLAADIRRETDASDALPAPAPEPATALAPECREMTLAVFALPDAARIAPGLDPEDLADLQRAFHRHVAAVAAEHGGRVAARLGVRALVAFGYPRAEEHDCERAVLAGLDAARTPLSLPRGGRAAVSAGIACGDTVVAPSEGGAEFAGAAVHLAEALSAAAPGGEVRISAEAERVVRRSFTTRPAAPGPGPAGAHRVERERLLPDRFDASKFSARLTPLVGRDAELAQLRALWAAAGQGALVGAAIVGEAGMGKSHLAHAFVDDLLPDRAAVIRMTASPLHRQSALWPLIQGLERLLDLPPGAGAAARRQALEAWADLRDVPRERVVPPMMALLSARRAPEAGAAPPDRAQVFAAVETVLRSRAARTPLVLLVEDIQWLDGMSTALLEHLAEALADTPILLLVTARPGPRPGWLERVQGRVLTLEPLSDRDARALAGQLMPAGFTRAALDRLVARAGGIPLYLEELARWSSAEDAGGAGVPETLHAALAARVDALGPAREVLQAAAVVGRTVEAPMLAAVTGLSEAALARRLEALQAADLLYRVGSGPHARYEFKHALVQEMTCDGLLKEHRAMLHLAVAEAMEAAPGGVTMPELAGMHFARAGAAERAIPHFEAAGRLAVRAGAPREAAAQVAEALAQLALLPEGPERDRRELGLLRLLGPQILAAEGLGAPRAAEVYARARTLLDRGAGDDPGEALIGEALAALPGPAGPPERRAAARLVQGEAVPDG